LKLKVTEKIGRRVSMKEYRVYRATKEAKNGAALSFSMRRTKPNEGAKFPKWLCFMDAANQKEGTDENGNARFDWDNKITFKIGEIDAGELLAFLTWRKATGS